MESTRPHNGRHRRASYRQLAWVPAAIKAGNQFHYRKKTPWRHNLLNLSLFGSILLAAAGTLSLSTALPAAVYLPVASLVFGLLIFASFILVVHESSHHMFVIARDERLSHKLNHLMGWLVCLPFGVDYQHHWQIGHVTHHIDPLEAHDPQNCTNTVLTGDAVRKALWRDAIPGYAHIFRKYDDCPGPKEYPARAWVFGGQVVFWLGLVWSSLTFLNWTALVAVLFGVQITLMLNRVKIAMEHGGPMLLRENQFLQSASSFFPLRHLVMPLNISLHFEHHLHFFIPWYDLNRYHQVLVDIIPAHDQEKVFRYRGQVLDTITSDDVRHLRSR